MGNFKKWLENTIPVPVVYQSHNYDCGAAALRAVCQFWGVGPEDEDDFIDACDTDPDNGTHPDDIVRVAKSFGLKVLQKTGITIDQLKMAIDSGRPVICPIQAWDSDSDITDNDSGHYVVAIGYDSDNILFQDPSIKNNLRGRLSFEEFDDRWHDVDADGRHLRRFGIIIWAEKRPEDTDHDMRSSKIK